MIEFYKMFVILSYINWLSPLSDNISFKYLIANITKGDFYSWDWVKYYFWTSSNVIHNFKKTNIIYIYIKYIIYDLPFKSLTFGA